MKRLFHYSADGGYSRVRRLRRELERHHRADAQSRADSLEHSDQYLQHERFERPAGLHRVPHRPGPHAGRGTGAPRRPLVSAACRACDQGKPSATRVIAGDAANSYMVQKLEGAADIVGERMPRGNGPFLTEGQMLVIRQWIKDGAPNN